MGLEVVEIEFEYGIASLNLLTLFGQTGKAVAPELDRKSVV